MKKIIVFCTCILCVFFLISCNKNLKINYGTYYAKTSENGDSINHASVVFNKEKVTMSMKPSSSYIHTGEYEVKEDKVYITDSDDNKYIFRILDDKLIFEEGKELEKYEKKGTEFILKYEAK